MICVQNSAFICSWNLNAKQLFCKRMLNSHKIQVEGRNSINLTRLGDSTYPGAYCPWRKQWFKREDSVSITNVEQIKHFSEHGPVYTLVDNLFQNFMTPLLNWETYRVYRLLVYGWDARILRPPLSDQHLGEKINLRISKRKKTVSVLDKYTV